jgi:hypothetical protein
MKKSAQNASIFIHHKLALLRKLLAVLHFSGKHSADCDLVNIMQTEVARSIAVVLFVLVLVASGCSQTPFSTDDADVTDKGKVHLEFVNEFDVLQRSSHPSLSQDTFVGRIAVGVHKRIELGVDIPAIAIFNSRETALRRSSGISDINAHIKIKLVDEKRGLAAAGVCRCFLYTASDGQGFEIARLRRDRLFAIRCDPKKPDQKIHPAC